MRKCFKKYLGKIRNKKRIMMWLLRWLNQSVVIINAMLQLLDIKYRLCLLNSNIILKQFVSSDIVIMS